MLGCLYHGCRLVRGGDALAGTRALLRVRRSRCNGPGFAENSDLAAHLAPDLQARVIDLRGGKSPNEADLATPRIFLTDFVSEDVSATQIRERIGRGERIDELVPPAVAGYIAKYDIYQWRA